MGESAQPTAQQSCRSRLIVFAIAFVCSMSSIWAQVGVWHTDSVRTTFTDKPVEVRLLAQDSLASVFLIDIATEVAPHYHALHTEVVYIEAGRGLLWLDGKEIELHPGMVVFIPANSIHAAQNIGSTPLQVISIQTPYFDGSDRIPVK